MPDGTFELLQVASEIEQVLDIYRARKPKRVLEIGSWDGGTLQLWLQNGAPELLAAVDLDHVNASAYEGWAKPGTEIRLHVGSSLEQPAFDFIAENGPFDWLFIDGDHGPGPVRSDFAVCEQNAAPGAIILLHDITSPEGIATYPPGVLLNELSEKYRVERYEDPTPMAWAHGIGVVYL